MPIPISQSDAIEMFDLPTEVLYVCDGKVPSCSKTYCSHNGNGECAHTTDPAHALYKVHDSNRFEQHPSVRDGKAAVILVEPIRG